MERGLFLSAYLPLDALPPEIAGLAAGIDPTASRPSPRHQPDPGRRGPHDARELGLRAGQLLRPDPAGGPGFDFRVASLQILFANSMLADFCSRIRIALNELFGTPVQQDQAPDNVLEIDGSYQRHGSYGTYLFTESGPPPIGPCGATPRFVGVRVVQAQFATAATPATAAARRNAATVVTSAFSFWGSTLLRRPDLPGTAGPADDPAPFDVLSFDSLVFADLRLAMTFPPVAPRRDLRPRRHAHDVRRGASVSRSHSLAAHFPVTPRSLVAGTGTTTPGDLGYATVVTDLDTAASARRGSASSTTSTWAPSARSPPGPGSSSASASSGRRAAAGLPRVGRFRCPGRPAPKDELTIEGVLKVSMFAIILSYAQGAFLLALRRHRPEAVRPVPAARRVLRHPRLRRSRSRGGSVVPRLVRRLQEGRPEGNRPAQPVRPGRAVRRPERNHGIDHATDARGNAHVTIAAPVHALGHAGGERVIVSTTGLLRIHHARTLDDIAAEIGESSVSGPRRRHRGRGQRPHQDLPVTDLVTEVLNASVRITDLVINTATETYGIGVALDFSADPPTLLGIQLDSIGFKVTRSKQHRRPSRRRSGLVTDPVAGGPDPTPRPPRRRPAPSWSCSPASRSSASGSRPRQRWPRGGHRSSPSGSGT